MTCGVIKRQNFTKYGILVILVPHTTFEKSNMSVVLINDNKHVHDKIFLLIQNDRKNTNLRRHKSYHINML